jgi:hypothetical protein
MVLTESMHDRFCDECWTEINTPTHPQMEDNTNEQPVAKASANTSGSKGSEGTIRKTLPTDPNIGEFLRRLEKGS